MLLHFLGFEPKIVPKYRLYNYVSKSEGYIQTLIDILLYDKAK